MSKRKDKERANEGKLFRNGTSTTKDEIEALERAQRDAIEKARMEGQKRLAEIFTIRGTSIPRK